METRIITADLRTLGIGRQYLGYNITIQAVRMVLNDENRLLCIMRLAHHRAEHPHHHPPGVACQSPLPERAGRVSHASGAHGDGVCGDALGAHFEAVCVLTRRQTPSFTIPSGCAIIEHITEPPNKEAVSCSNAS